MAKCKLNTKLLPVKIHYFLLNGAHAGVIPFIPVFAVQLGISASAVGIILAVLSCLTVISKAIFGSIVDHFQKLHQVLLFLIFVDVAADLGLNFIPRTFQVSVNITSDNFLCHQRNSYSIGYNGSECGSDYSNSTSSCHLSCFLCEHESSSCQHINKTISEPRNLYSNESKLAWKKCLQDTDGKCTNACSDGSELCQSVAGTNPSLQVWLLSLFATLVFVANGSIVSLSDAACYNALANQPQNFGRQRMWGTIGWGLFALLTGYLNQVFTGSSKIYSYSSGFYLLLVLFALDLIVIRNLQLKNVSLSKNIFKDVGSLLVKPKIVVFLLCMFGIGLLTGISRSYLYWYLRTTLGASQLVLGCTAAVQCFLGELPFFFFSGIIISKMGHINTFTMSFLAYGLKFLIHSLLTNPWWALPVELLQGPCFGSFYSAMTSYSKTISPKGTEATMQGIVSGTFEGLGVAAGSLLGGFCIGYFGGRETFYYIGVISFTIGLFHWLSHFITACRKTGSCQ